MISSAKNNEYNKMSSNHYCRCSNHIAFCVRHVIMITSLLLLLLHTVPFANAFGSIHVRSSHHGGMTSYLNPSASLLLQNSKQLLSYRQYNNNVRSITTKLYMSWGPEPIWKDITISSQIIPACESGKSVLLQLSVPYSIAMEYKVPGQYVQIRPKHIIEKGEGAAEIKPLFLAIASAPPTTNDENQENIVFEFLIKKNDQNLWLTSGLFEDMNSIIEMSQVLGKGFTISDNLDSLKYDFPTQNILLFASGSGIAPIVAAIRSGQLQSNKRTCRLYYGERTISDLCYIDQYSIWENNGIQVVPVLSQSSADSSDDEWKGRIGYVQNALEEDGISIPRNTGALLCGMKGMTEAVKQTLIQAGVFDGRVLFNF